MPRKVYMFEDTQAHRVIQKFGGARKLAIALTKFKRLIDPEANAVDASGIYKWRMPREKGGTGGLVPSSALEFVIGAARMEGILFTKDELLPFKGNIRG